MSLAGLYSLLLISAAGQMLEATVAVNDGMAPIIHGNLTEVLVVNCIVANVGIRF